MTKLKNNPRLHTFCWVQNTYCKCTERGYKIFLKSHRAGKGQWGGGGGVKGIEAEVTV